VTPADITSSDADTDGTSNCIPRAFYRDEDGDEFGGPEVAMTACAAPKGFVDNGQDCDDDDPERNPAAVEVCDGGIDNNCDGDVVATRQSLYFIQLTDRVQISHQASLELPVNFTIEAWVKRTGGGGWVYNKWAPGVEDTGLRVGARGSGVGRARIGVDVHGLASVPNQVDRATWHHLAIVHDPDPDRANRFRLFIDGDLANSTTTRGGLPQGDRHTLIGASRRGPPGEVEWQRPVNGFIASVRLSDFARYRGSDFDPEWNLKADERTVGLWRLDEGAGNTVRDTSGGGAHGTIVGADWKETECR
jgi:hypothetical protein